jgi:hypothetical protein
MIGKQILLSFSWEKNILTEEGSEKNVRAQWKSRVSILQLPSYKQYKKNFHENDKQMVLFI